MYATSLKEQQSRHLETALQRTIFIGDRVSEIARDIHESRNAARRRGVKPNREVRMVQQRRMDRLYAVDWRVRGGLSHEERCELSDINVDRLISKREGRH